MCNGYSIGTLVLLLVYCLVGVILMICFNTTGLIVWMIHPKIIISYVYKNLTIFFSNIVVRKTIWVNLI